MEPEDLCLGDTVIDFYHNVKGFVNNLPDSSNLFTLKYSFKKASASYNSDCVYCKIVLIEKCYL